jgi:hypothetical protein
VKRYLRLAPILALSILEARGQTPAPNKVPVEKTRPLPEIPAGDQKFSSYAPAHPYTELAPSVLSRTVFEAPGPTGYRVEVRDLRVAAGKKAENLTLPGAVIFEVRYGAGGIVIGGKRQALELGSEASISEGQTFSLESSGEQPLTIRAYLLRSQ